jgi:hypothetical protein
MPTIEFDMSADGPDVAAAETESRWSATDWRPVRAAPVTRTPRAPEHLRGRIVAERIAGTVVARFGSMLTVQSDRGERLHGISDIEIRFGDPVTFAIVADPSSQLRVASNITSE